MQLLIDGDIVAYRFASIHQTEVNWTGRDEEPSIILHPSRAKYDISNFISWLAKETLTGDDPIICFTGHNNFRKSVCPSYKANRVTDKPKMFQEMREFMEEKYICVCVDELEADDIMGLLSTYHPNKYVIATIDKDLQQIHGHNFNWNTKEKRYISELEADRFFFKQVLMGDKCDGVRGIGGIGDKRSDRILEEVEVPKFYVKKPVEEAYWKAVVEAYENKGLTEEYAIEQARLVRILRASEYNIETGVITLWQPPKLLSRKSIKELILDQLEEELLQALSQE